MAVLSVRKDDVEAIKAVLETDTYKDVDGMARAVLKTAFEALRARELWTVAFRLTPEGAPIFFGIEGTENAARKFAEGMGTGGTAQLVKIYSMTDFEQRLLDTARQEWDAQEYPCVNCGQYRWQHLPFIGFNGKPLANQGPKRLTKCKTYSPPASPDWEPEPDPEGELLWA